MTTRALIVGGGLHGCCTAIHLAQRGFSVTVLEQDSVGRHASGVNAGGVRQLMRHPDEIPLSVAAMERWLKLDALLGPELAPLCEFVCEVGQVAVAETDADMAVLRARVQKVEELGWQHEEVIDQAELRRVVPALSQHCIGGLVCRQDGYANPGRTAQAFRMRAQAVGAQVEEGVRVTGLNRIGQHWRVASSAGDYEADLVVNCAGAWGWQISALVGEALPRTHWALSMMVTGRMPHFLDPVVIGVGRHLSFKQTEVGTVVIGGGMLGVPDLHARTADPLPERLAASARTVCDLFPVMRGATIIRAWAGLEGCMPDGIPVIGRSAVAPGLFHAFGFSGHGFQLAPIVGELLAQLIADDHSSLPLKAFRADRFVAKPASLAEVVS
jgi:sarcosine oxidase, subunit beta